MQPSTETPEGMPPADGVGLAVEVFRMMLANATRVRLLWALPSGERPVNELATMVGKSLSGVSTWQAAPGPLGAGSATTQPRFYRIENEHVTSWSRTRSDTPSTRARASPNTTDEPRPDRARRLGRYRRLTG